MSARRRSLRSMRLRTRVTLFFTIAGLLASAGLSVASYYAARSYLLEQRDEVATRQAFNNAQLVRTILRSQRTATAAGELIGSIRTENNGFAVLHLERDDQFFTQNLRFTEAALPNDLRETVEEGGTGFQRFTYGDTPYVAVGVHITGLDVNYYEAFALTSEQRTLRIISTTLTIGTLVAGLFAALLGWAVGRRLVRPLTRVADAAGEIASGGLSTRMEREGDPDLDRIASSFNDMADTLQGRIEREARFASDVSHELRSPITALSAAVEVLDARRADLPERSGQALDVVVNQVRRFDQMVIDLLELSRLDVGISDLHREDLQLSDVVGRIAQRHGSGEVPVVVQAGADRVVPVDKRRLERIVVNLLDNARIHAGGAQRIGIENGPGDTVLLAVEDAGPGVSASEKARIFERFARGTASRHRVGGTGLGLALVAEHARAHGGDAWVEDRAGGGARFVVRFPGALR